MTDAEIIKGLECCEFDINDKPCEKCPYYKYLKTTACISFMASNALALIERLQERVAIQAADLEKKKQGCEECKYADHKTTTSGWQIACKLCVRYPVRIDCWECNE